MARRNPQERQGSPFRLPAILFPVTKRVHADAERLGEVSLRQANEPTERGYIARPKLSAHDALTLAAAQASRKISSAEFRNIPHDPFSMCSW
jgi:hypothetical protein